MNSTTAWDEFDAPSARAASQVSGIPSTPTRNADQQRIDPGKNDTVTARRPPKTP
jgi:hypothetical protein